MFPNFAALSVGSLCVSFVSVFETLSNELLQFLGLSKVYYATTLCNFVSIGGS